MILFLAIVCTTVMATWVVIPLLTPKPGIVPRATPDQEALISVLKALRELNSRAESGEDESKVRTRLEKDRAALYKKLSANGLGDSARLCKNCDALSWGNEKFCHHCGIPLEQEVITGICPGCKKSCSQEFSFCTHCGQDLSNSK